MVRPVRVWWPPHWLQCYDGSGLIWSNVRGQDSLDSTHKSAVLPRNVEDVNLDNNQPNVLSFGRRLIFFSFIFAKGSVTNMMMKGVGKLRHLLTVCLAKVENRHIGQPQGN